MLVRSALLAALALLVSGFSEPLTPPTPDLLKGVTAKGGWWNGGCPEDPKIKDNTPEAISPELTSRLTAQFPKGSDAAKVWPALSKLGFQAQPPCTNDPQVKRTIFRQSGANAPMNPSWIFASIAWRVDAGGKIEWIKGSLVPMIRRSSAPYFVRVARMPR